MTSFVKQARHGRVVTITMDKPDKRNALSTEEECIEFAELLDALNADTGVSVVVLTGAGSCFSAGGDIRNMKEQKGLSAGGPAELRATYRRAVQRLARSMYSLEMPAIAAVNGPASGVGLDLALLCDVRIAGQSARFAESFIKVGLIPGDGGAWLLQRVIGLSNAAEMTFTGDLVDAEHALRTGLVSKVVGDDALMGAAQELAERMAVNPPRALRHNKRLMREAMLMSFPDHLEAAVHLQSHAQRSDEHFEAVSAFLEKRRPSFDT